MTSDPLYTARLDNQQVEQLVLIAEDLLEEATSQKDIKAARALLHSAQQLRDWAIKEGKEPDYDMFIRRVYDDVYSNA